MTGNLRKFLLWFSIRPLLVTGLAGLLIIGVWVGYIYQRWGIFSVSTLSGYQIVQHTGQWFELLPDEYADLRDTFLKYRQIQIDENGTPANAIWDAIPELLQVSGLGQRELGGELTRLSIQLILAHPGRYLLSVLDGWQLFWRAPVYWRPANIADEGVRSALAVLVTAERAALVAANIVFLAGSILALAWPRWRAVLGSDEPARSHLAGAKGVEKNALIQHTLPGNTAFWCFVALTVWLTSIVQALPDHGDNPRFLAPLQSWVVLWVLWAGWKTLRAARKTNP